MPRNAANFTALTPLDFVERASYTFGDAVAVIDGRLQRTWSETWDRSRKLAHALSCDLGVQSGSVVSTLLDNTPELVESHYAVPMAGAILGAINTRLDAPLVAYILEHSESEVLIYDRKYEHLASAAVGLLKISTNGMKVPHLLSVGDGSSGVVCPSSYEDLVNSGTSSFEWVRPSDEFSTIALNYTSGTTGQPKGVAVHHRGMYLGALGNTLAFGGMPTEGKLRYLWTLPMFHCNGWCFPYTIAALGGAHVCLRSVDVASIGHAFTEHGVTHLCGAPIVLGFAIDALKALHKPMQQANGTTTSTSSSAALPPRPPIKMMVAAAPPPPSVLSAAASAGLDVTHVYGLTEVYGPAAVCEWRDKWDGEGAAAQAAKRSRQGVGYVTAGLVDVRDRDTGEPVPADGETLGEVVFSGNQVMKGYFKDEAATAEAFRGGMFWTGDLGVKDPDHYVALRDRAKDIVISGGENISTIEVENVLVTHGAVAAAAVVAQPDERWGEAPCAFVELDPKFLSLSSSSSSLSEEGQQQQQQQQEEVLADEIIAHAKAKLARFKAPKRVVFGPLPKTSTGKIQKHVLRDRIRGASAGTATNRSFSSSSSSSNSSSSSSSAPSRRGMCSSSSPTQRAHLDALLSGSAADDFFFTSSLVHSACDEDGVLFVTLTRGPKRNALSGALLDDLSRVLAQAHVGPGVRAIVLQGDGPAFSSGHDLQELKELQEARDEGAVRSLFRRCGDVTRLIREAPVPVVAAVHGPAHAAGCEVAASCDLVVADEATASFATPGVRVGLFCHTPAVAVCRALGGGSAGARRAAKMLYTGEVVSAQEALRLGLVHELAPPGSAQASARALALRIARASPFVVRQGKETLRETSSLGVSDERQHEIAAEAMTSGLMHPDATEGIGAFLEKRSPKWRTEK